MFAYWKWLLAFKPNISDLVAEATTLFALNHTGAWLAAKGEVERNAIILKAQKDVKSIRAQYKARQVEIQEARRENLAREREECERKEKARKEEMRRLTQKIEVRGLWLSPAAVDEGLGKMSTGKRGDERAKVQAVKDQINFRKKVLKQKFESAKLTSFSENGVAFFLEELVTKLKVVVQMK